MDSATADSAPVPVPGRSSREAGLDRSAAEEATQTLYYVTSDSLGVDREIGCRLAQAFWNSLHERLEEPATFALVNRGIFLALDDSPALEGLRRLAVRGCPIYACGTCLDFYGAHDRLAVGDVGSIPILQELMARATKVITI